MRLSVFAEEFGPTMRDIALLQVLFALIWVLSLWSQCGAASRWDEYGVMRWWLPLNYLAFDLYLLVREGLSRWRGRSSFARSSATMKDFLYLSPIVMLVTTPFLGLIGSKLHVALGLWAG